MIDSLIQTAIFGCAVNVSGAAIAFYFWTENRSERYLFFWGTALSLGAIRWAIHIPAASSPMLLVAELILISLITLFVVLSCYDLLPSKPWRQRAVVIATSLGLTAYTVAVIRSPLPIEMGYGLYAMTLGFAAWCLWMAWRAHRLSGYALAAATFLFEFVLVSTLLAGLGRGVSNSTIVPLYNLPLMLCIALIAHQRDRRRLLESERTLQKIFDTAPAPIVIVRPPRYEIERANAVAYEMLGISPDAAVGRTAVEQGLVPDVEHRIALYADVAAGKRVRAQEMILNRGGSEQRVISVNADLIALDSGDRVIYSFFDLTDLRRAEEDLRQSADEIRRLYVQLSNVEEDERRALHVELHDRVGANLAALRLELDIAEKHLAGGDGASVHRHLSSARAVAAETMAIARNLMAELRPPALDDFGLVAALRSFAEAHSLRLDVPVDVSGANLAPRPSLPVESTLFRIAQEAVINATRHAAATCVTVSVQAIEGRITLTIEDDGLGFDPEAQQLGADHWGIRNMHERARALGGSLRIESAVGAGTRVIADVPRGAE